MPAHNFQLGMPLETILLYSIIPTTMNRQCTIVKKGRSLRFSDLNQDRFSVIHQTIDERVAVNAPNCSDASLRSLSPRRTCSDDGISNSKKSNLSWQQEPGQQLIRKHDELDDSNHTRKTTTNIHDGTTAEAADKGMLPRRSRSDVGLYGRKRDELDSVNHERKSIPNDCEEDVDASI